MNIIHELFKKINELFMIISQRMSCIGITKTEKALVVFDYMPETVFIFTCISISKCYIGLGISVHVLIIYNWDLWGPG
jgi:hypothetical protein